jgi:YspA, cpYpsA-related SLOG family
MSLQHTALRKNLQAKSVCFYFSRCVRRKVVHMKLIIAGSRTFTDYQLLCHTLAPERHRITEVLHGGARGADQLGFRWAVVYPTAADNPIGAKTG